MKLVLLAMICGVLPGASLRYWVEPCGNGAGGCHSGDPELAQWAMEAWQTASGGHLKLEKTSERDKAQIRIFWSGGREGLYGEARPITVEGIRGAEVYVLPPRESPDQDGLMRDAVVYLTCLHEAGHALGLPHTAAFADIMYSFQFGGDIPEYFGRYRRLIKAREDIRKYPGMSADDRRRVVELFR